MIGTNNGETSFSKAFYLRSSARRRSALRMLSVYDPHNAERVVSAYGGGEARTDYSELLADALFWAPSLDWRSRTPPKMKTPGCTASITPHNPCGNLASARFTLSNSTLSLAIMNLLAP